MSKQVKVFQLNDFDWWAGYDLESVKAAYLADMGLKPTDHPDDLEDQFDNPHELTEEELDRFKFIYVDREEGDPEEAPFRERLNEVIALGHEFPCFFASTEW
jgi:hypothetical protein